MPRPNNRFYDLLDVAPNVSPGGLDRAWERVRDRLERKGDEERLAEAKAAYDVLSDPGKRATYDQHGEAGL